MTGISVRGSNTRRLRVCTEFFRTVADKELASEAPEQGGEAGSVDVGHGDKFQAEALTGGRMAYDGVSSNLSLGDEKLQICRSADLARRRRSQKQTTEAHIQDARDVVVSIATPADPYFFVQSNARVESSRRRRCFWQHWPFYPVS